MTEFSRTESTYTDDVVAVMRDTISALREQVAELKRDLLLAKPLRLRFDAENAVLAAMADVTIQTNEVGAPMMGIEDEYAVCRAELKRREAAQ